MFTGHQRRQSCNFCQKVPETGRISTCSGTWRLLPAQTTRTKNILHCRWDVLMVFVLPTQSIFTHSCSETCWHCQYFNPLDGKKHVCLSMASKARRMIANKRIFVLCVSPMRRLCARNYNANHIVQFFPLYEKTPSIQTRLSMIFCIKQCENNCCSATLCRVHLRTWQRCVSARKQ